MKKNNQIINKYKEHLANPSIHNSDSKINKFCNECGVIYSKENIDYKKYLDEMINKYKDIPTSDILNILFEINNYHHQLYIEINEHYEKYIDDSLIIKAINYLKLHYIGIKDKELFIKKYINIFNDKNIRKIKDNKIKEYIILNNPNAFSVTIINRYLKNHTQDNLYHILKLPMDKIKQLKFKVIQHRSGYVIMDTESFNDPIFFDKLYELEKNTLSKIKIETTEIKEYHLINKIIKEFRLNYIYRQYKKNLIPLFACIAAQKGIKTKNEFAKFLETNTINIEDKKICGETMSEFISYVYFVDDDYNNL